MSTYRAQKAMFGDSWVVERQFACINGLSAWFAIVTVDEPSEAETGYTEGAFGSAQERAEQIATALNSRDVNATAQQNLREAWAALAMIRETVETLAPIGSVKAAEQLDGPTFMHEAEALVEGIRRMAKP